MRNFTTIVILFLCAIPTFTNAEFVDSVYQFSTGNNDLNPKFPIYTGDNYSYSYEYFVFERHVNTSSSKIFMQKVDGEGPNGTEIELSENNFKNSNPVIAYNNHSFGNELTPEYILVVWQTNKNGTEDIYGKYFINGSWSNEFAIDSSAQTSVSPQIICRDSIEFFIVYEKEGEIIYREFNILTSTLSAAINITSDDTTNCRNPFIGLFGPTNNEDSLIIVSYERSVSPVSVPIHYKINSNGTWSSSMTISGSGVNVNNGFFSNDYLFTPGIISAYEREESFNKNIYIKLVSESGTGDSILITTHNPSNYSSLTGGRPYFIRDGKILNIFAFIENNSFDKSALFYTQSPIPFQPDLKIQVTPEFSFDTLDVTLTANHKVSKQIPNGGCTVYWFLFNKSETGQYQSRIHGVKFKSCFEVNITPISSEIPNSFSLKQNYPNPFNPATKIRFDIPGSLKQVKLSVYNSIGQEVEVLIDEQLQPGIYEYDLNASSYPSGVYFYRLEAGDFSETKRMVLVK